MTAFQAFSLNIKLDKASELSAKRRKKQFDYSG